MIYYAILSLISLFVVYIFYFGTTIYKDLKRERMIKNFAYYTTTWEHYLGKAYDMIHKDKILIYSLEATTLPDEEFNEVSKTFVNLVRKIMGPTLFKEFQNFYGDYDTLIFNILEFFNTHYEYDEIRKGSMENLMETEVDMK